MKHFNTMPGLTQVQQQEMKFNNWTFPDLAPSDFNLFQKLKEHLKGQRFSYDEEVKSAVRKWFQKQNTNGQVWKISAPPGFDLRTIQ